MGSAQRELVAQYEIKILEYSQFDLKLEYQHSAFKKKEKELLETTAELNWAKSALKSGEVKEMLLKLPGLLMETTEKTLIK